MSVNPVAASPVPVVISARPPRIVRIAKWMLRASRQQPLGTIGAVVVFVFLVAATVPGLVAPYDPDKVGVGARLEGSSWSHVMGTDSIGRDVFSRIIWGARLSVLIGFGSVLVGTTVGTAIGLVSGYAGGLADTLIQRFVDALMTFPGLILALVLVTVWGQGVPQLVLAIAILIIPGATRIVRGATLAEKNNQYIDAARVLGASHHRILFRHILPNVSAPIIVIVSVMVGVAILIEAALSFLGLGVPPPTSSWGQMLSIEGRTYMLQQPWLAIWPGLAISLVVLGLNLVGDALRDLLDPKLRLR